MVGSDGQKWKAAMHSRKHTSSLNVVNSTNCGPLEQVGSAKRSFVNTTSPYTDHLHFRSRLSFNRLVADGVWTVSLTEPEQNVLRGAAAIARHLFGDPKLRRAVYYHAEKRHLPVFRVGATICARKSSLDAWIADQERYSSSGTHS